MPVPLVHILRTGFIPYGHGLRLQNLISSKLKEDATTKGHNVLILTEHKPVYTIGIRTKDYTINDEEYLRSLGAEFHKTNRGGLITFHGPGQLVAYPVINLKQFQPSMRWYICHLEKTIIDLCRHFNLTAQTTPDTGVWINDRKVCAIGVHGSRYITTHGLALNCNIDLCWFEHIVPCGLVGKAATSLTSEAKRTISIDETEPLFLSCFEKTFNCNLVELSNDTAKAYLEKITCN